MKHDEIKVQMARIATEVRGYTVSEDDLDAPRYDTLAELLQAVIARGAPGGNIGWWAYMLAGELAVHRGAETPDEGTRIEYERALASAARAGQLTMRPPRASAIAESVTSETTDERLKNGLVTLRADMQAYAERHAPDLLRSALLADPQPAEQAALRTRGSIESDTPARWPWGDYTTQRLELLADAARKFWSLYDPADASTAPTNEQVVVYLCERGLSSSAANAMATILRADGLPTGPRK